MNKWICRESTLPIWLDDMPDTRNRLNNLNKFALPVSFGTWKFDMIVLCQFAHHYLSSDEQREGLHGLFVSIVPTTCIPPISGLFPTTQPLLIHTRDERKLTKVASPTRNPLQSVLIQVCIINLYQLQFNYCKYHVWKTKEIPRFQWCQSCGFQWTESASRP